MPDFDAIARELATLGDDEPAITRILQRRCPRVAADLRHAGERPGLLGLWGSSLNVDENTGSTIVPDPILRAVCGLAGVAVEPPAAHAGLMHTYAYLFSRLKTPYGLKRDRWVDRRIERAAGLLAGSLVPQPKQGTLLTNLTYFLGRLAFRGRSREGGILRRNRTAVAPAVLDVPYRRMRWARITETLRPLGRRVVRLHTDLLPPAGDGGNEQSLLVLSVEDSAAPLASLITVFPIAKSMVEALVDPSRLGRCDDIRVRYNAHVAGLANGPHAGTRAVRIVSPGRTGPAPGKTV